MKKFINNHPRLYWIIVVTLAVLAFMVITCIGFGKLEKANASISPEGVWYPDLKGIDFGEDADGVNTVLGKYPCFAVGTWKQSTCDSYRFVFGYDDMKYAGGSVYVELRAYAMMLVNVSFDGSITCDRIIDFGSPNGVQIHYFDGSLTLIGSNISLSPYNSTAENYYDKVKVLPQNNLVHPVEYKETFYHGSAPYATYNGLVVDNKLALGTAVLGHIEDLYMEYLVPSTWTYHGIMNNVSDEDEEYNLNLKFSVEVPTLEYIRGLYADFGYSTDIGRIVLKRNKEILEHWYEDASAETYSVDFEYSLAVQPNSDGSFEYSFTYLEWEYLLRAYSESLRTVFEANDNYWRAIMLSFLHVKEITMEVLTTRGESVVYSGYTTNRFERGVYDMCVEAWTNVDKNFVTPDLLEDMISKDVTLAEREYLKELEQKVEDLQDQVDNMTGTLGSFDSDFDGNALWGAVKSLGAGLISMSGFIASFAVVLGSFFTFLPCDVQSYVWYLFLVALVVVLWKLLKK